MYHPRIRLDGGGVITAKVGISVSPLLNGGQHTISWSESIALPVAIDRKPATLLPGSCNLYSYPKVFFDHLRKGKGVVPPPEQLFVLEELVKALILDEDEQNSIAFVRDPVGAAPLHGLLVANTEASLGLALEVYQARPSLLTQYHTGKIFTGENALHILAVNTREDVLCECVVIAASNLTHEQCKGLFQKQATGIFFTDEPMAYYGGSPISYAVAFSLQRALTTMLVMSKEHKAMHGVVDFNAPQTVCKHTGFLPLHVAVANSLTSMVNFLIDLPGLTIEYDDMRANPNALSGFGKLTELSLLSPLQTAVKLGDKKLVQYILRTQSKQQWVWGPVSLYHLDLHGIDSIGETGNDMMELVTRLDASEATQQMLLDSFMDGIVHKLFEQKFNMLRWFHYTLLGLQLFSVLTFYAVALLIKQAPAEMLYPTSPIYIALPYVSLASIVPLLEEDLRAASNWLRVFRSAPVDEETRKLLREGALSGRLIVYSRQVRMLLQWMNSHKMFNKMVGWALAAFGLVWLLFLRSHAADSAYWDKSQVHPRDRTDILIPFLSLACFIHTEAFFRSFLFEFETIGTFYKTVYKMLGTDVTYWLILFVIFLTNYGLVMYMAYPRFKYSADEIALLDPVAAAVATAKSAAFEEEPVPRFENFIGAVQSLFELGFIGEPVDIDINSAFGAEDTDLRMFWKRNLFYLFLFFYLMYITMSLILLLNLLIAMMSDTYATSMEHSVLVWRVDYSRRVLRLELQCAIFHKCGLVQLHCGEKVGNGKTARWVWPFKTYQANAEGGGLRGAATSMFDEGIEEEAEEDEKDDDGPGAAAPSDTVLQLQSRSSKKVNSSQDLIAGAGVAPRGSTKRKELQRKLWSRQNSGGAGSGFKVVGASVVAVEHLQSMVSSPRSQQSNGRQSKGAAAFAPAASRQQQMSSLPDDVEEIDS